MWSSTKLRARGRGYRERSTVTEEKLVLKENLHALYWDNGEETLRVMFHNRRLQLIMVQIRMPLKGFSVQRAIYGSASKAHRGLELSPMEASNILS